jgi:hypothetical protein
MVNLDQQEMFDVLEKQQQHQRQVDRVLKIVLPIVSGIRNHMCQYEMQSLHRHIDHFNYCLWINVLSVKTMVLVTS